MHWCWCWCLRCCLFRQQWFALSLHSWCAYLLSMQCSRFMIDDKRWWISQKSQLIKNLLSHLKLLLTSLNICTITSFAIFNFRGREINLYLIECNSHVQSSSLSCGVQTARISINYFNWTLSYTSKYFAIKK